MPHSDEDMARLTQVLIAYAGVLAEAIKILDVLETSGFRNVSVAGRAKTTPRTLEKLARDKPRLSSIEDLAGARIITYMTFTEQDALAARVRDVFGFGGAE